MRRPRRTEDFREYSYIKKFSEAEKRFTNFNGNQEVALIFPNTYKVASASLAWSWVQQLLWGQGIAVERFFYEKWFKKFYSIESFTPLDQFKILLFSFHFELDFENIIDILIKLGIPPLSEDRNENHPVVIIGGPITFFNYEIARPIADLVYIGDLEYNVEEFSHGLRLMLKEKNEGIRYLERFDNILSVKKGNFKRLSVKNYDISKKLPVAHFITPFSEFKNKRLIEIGRGCIRRCSFCVMGYTKKPVKFVPPDVIEVYLKNEKNSVGIISATITDYPWLDELLDILEKYEIKFSVSSMRADGITDRLLKLLKRSEQKVFTIAPEGISQKIRNLILKDISEEDLMNSLELGRINDFRNVKLYYIVGFEEEDESDYTELKEFIAKVKKLGYREITLSINPLIPKKATPFYNRRFITEREYNKIIKWMRTNLKGVKLHFESYKFAKKQYTYNVLKENDIENLIRRIYVKKDID
ncbi:MAG: radical SAM protein [Thermosipho sp. (in: Bacteria)]|nr:radical SAM protein [Thermosipho sp. (in: thermotogales)]